MRGVNEGGKEKEKKKGEGIGDEERWKRGVSKGGEEKENKREERSSTVVKKWKL